jgi:methylated-DNA-[protein]-cysteine S-methyltransferase
MLTGHAVMDQKTQRSCVFETAAGFCAVAWSELGVTRFILPMATHAAVERTLERRSPGAGPGEPPPAVAEAIALATRYFSGEPSDFSAVALDLGDQDPFFAEVYRVLRGTGFGRTTTYGALAAAVGANREAARDVGQAMAQNPMPLLIPCHRVLAAGGKLGGFSAPGGAKTKARMLRMEGVEVAPREPAQRSFAF